MQRVNVYIDGFNFYNGLVDSNWKKYYWLDMVQFSKEILKILKDEHELINTYYFSAPPHNHISKAKRQAKFFLANEQSDKFKPILGYHKDRSRNCSKCKKAIPMSEEKQTDVNIALHMLGCAVTKECDLSILVSGDTDMIPIVQAIKNIDPTHQVMAFFPPSRKTHRMISYLDGWRDLINFEECFKNSLLPNTVKLKIPLEGKNDVVIPDKWKDYKDNAASKIITGTAA